MFNSLQSHGLQHTRLLCPWNSPSKNAGVGCQYRFLGHTNLKNSDLVSLRWDLAVYSIIYFLRSNVFSPCLFIYFCLCWVFIAACRLSLIMVRRLLIATAPCCRAWGLGTWAWGVVVHGLRCFEACRIFLDQSSDPCLLHWQADS